MQTREHKKLKVATRSPTASLTGRRGVCYDLSMFSRILLLIEAIAFSGLAVNIAAAGRPTVVVLAPFKHIGLAGETEIVKRLFAEGFNVIGQEAAAQIKPLKTFLFSLAEKWSRK